MNRLPNRVLFTNILFPTDFSQAATPAQLYAASLARAYGAKLWAVHVRAPAMNAIAGPSSRISLAEAARTQREEQRRTLADAFSSLNSEIIIEEGSFWPVMEGLIEKKKIDLIVMGTHGRSGIGKFVLGSASEETFRKAHCPVLTVGPHGTESLDREPEFSHVLFATDLRPDCLNAVPYALSIAQEFQAQLTVVHVIENARAGEFVGAPELRDASLQLLEDTVPSEARQWCTPEFVVEQGDPAECVLQIARKRRVNLVVLGARRPSGIPGAAIHLPIATAHKIVSNSPCPVLTFPH